MMSVPEFHFTRDWTNPADFPTHQNNEAQNRADLEEAKTELENYINNTLLPAIANSGGGGGSGGGGVSGDYLPLDGGTMRGVLRLFRNPQLDTEAVTKDYVDDKVRTIATDGDDIAQIRLDVDEIESLVQAIRDGVVKIGRILVGAEQITLEVLNGYTDETFIHMLANQITIGVNQYTDGNNAFARLTLSVFGEEAAYGLIQIDGNLDISGQVSADALYAQYGEISDLHVDYLDTSRRIVRYLRGDTSDNNYLRAHDQILEFVTGHCTGGAVQATNPNGALLYWPMDVSGLTLGDDGYPRYEGVRVFTTLETTQYPVYVYQYTEQIKRAITFAQDATNSEIYNVYDVFGAGNAQGLNRAYIVKTANGFDIRYTTSSNKVLGVHMDNNGYTDIDGLRKTTGLDFSHFHEGYFTETVQGAAQAKEYRVTFDGNGVPTGITDEGGNTTAISW